MSRIVSIDNNDIVFNPAVNTYPYTKPRAPSIFFHPFPNLTSLLELFLVALGIVPRGVGIGLHCVVGAVRSQTGDRLRVAFSALRVREVHESGLGHAPDEVGFL